MNISWKISQSDIQKIKTVLKENHNPFLLKRQERNVLRKNIVLDENTIVYSMIACLLTSQQRSGPNSIVGRFMQKTPFPITNELIQQSKNVEKEVKEILFANGLTRYINRISLFFALNISKIQIENWIIIEELNNLKLCDSKGEERKYADIIASKFSGFGPKQSRNFLQSIGLTKYEIPIDSRITNWLNNFGFPVTLTSSALSDTGYYHFVSDGIQELCEKANIYPCLLDAAIFSSFDNGEWTEENSVF
jgi:thermostable 8-oxoguanine DNA glycosylase